MAQVKVGVVCLFGREAECGGGEVVGRRGRGTRASERGREWRCVLASMVQTSLGSWWTHSSLLLGSHVQVVDGRISK